MGKRLDGSGRTASKKGKKLLRKRSRSTLRASKKRDFSHRAILLDQQATAALYGIEGYLAMLEAVISGLCLENPLLAEATLLRLGAVYESSAASMSREVNIQLTLRRMNGKG